MRLFHVAAPTVFEGSGITQLAPRLCRALIKLGHQVELHVLAPAAPGAKDVCSLTEHQSWPAAGRLGFSWSFAAAIARAAKTADVIHVHSLWMWPNIFPGWLNPRESAPIVIAPQGTLSIWALKQSRVQKAIAWWLLGQRLALRRAACLQATAKSEYDDLRRCGFHQPIAIIPNGIDLPGLPPHPAPKSERRILLFMSRIHPKKGLDTLINAWANVAHRFPDWDLEVVGPPDPPSYLSEMQALADRVALGRVAFRQAAYGTAKSEALWRADLFALPTRSDNFAIVVAEALAHGVPVITTREAPWQGLETERCGWWIEDSLEAVTAALDDALSLDRGVLAEMGERGRTWVERDFGWDHIALQLSEVYLWLLGRGGKPEFVIVE